MAFDVERARRETPGAARVAHLNNAGAALPPSAVTEAVIAYLRHEAVAGGYEAADAARARVEGVYGSVARRTGAVIEVVDDDASVHYYNTEEELDRLIAALPSTSPRG